MNVRNCPACRGPMVDFGHARVLHRHDVDYFECPRCGLVCTEQPYWLKEAYAEPIATSDIGLVARNLSLVNPVAVVLSMLFDGSGRFLDFGGGHGLFVRLMRDKGYDFRWLDEWTPNQFARGFEHRPGDRYEGLTAFEVFEHLANPRDTLSDLVALSDHIIFSTELVPPTRPRPGHWWYYALDSGQHVTLYTARALEELASTHGLHYHTDGVSLHMFTKRAIPRPCFRLMVDARIARLLRPWVARRSSLLPADVASHRNAPVERGASRCR